MLLRDVPTVLRYPGGKQKYLKHLSKYLPERDEIEGRYVEPFVGGGAVFLYVNPNKAFISDINKDLIDFYRGIVENPDEVWKRYCSYGNTKDSYYMIRDENVANTTLIERAARILYLNRTSFRGNWRHNSKGKFNVGYGGESRRWNINLEKIKKVATRLRNTYICCIDFQEVVESCQSGDFLFVDPPYHPFKRELSNAHYTHGDFSFEDQIRLSKLLDDASKRGVRWVMTNTSNSHVLDLYPSYFTTQLHKGSSNANTGEIIIHNL